MAIELEVLTRFGMWPEILQQPEPPPSLPITYSMWRFSRAAALNALDRTGEAKRERKLFSKAVARVPKDATFGNNSAGDLLQIAGHVLDGEIAARESRWKEAIRSFESATRIEDTLRYDEPPDWLLPVRHTYGATLLRAARYPEAERVYREDLNKFPSNVWSLHGLHRALALQGRETEAAAVKNDFMVASKGADTEIQSSCLCQPAV